MTTTWRVETVTGPAASLLGPPEAGRRAVRFVHPVDRAVVLGSTQPEAHVDTAAAAAAQTGVLRRRSGGGAVLVGPGLVLWADVVIPAGDALWCADVGRAFWWLGDVWAAALLSAGLPGGQVWRGGLVRSRWSDRVCFAGLGPGEVSVGGAKVVGLSQRRSRAGAQFQCAVAVVWQPSELLALMVLDGDARARASADLAGAAAGVGPGVASGLVAAFEGHLP